jgi:hypothetical protein
MNSPYTGRFYLSIYLLDTTLETARVRLVAAVGKTWFPDSPLAPISRHVVLCAVRCEVRNVARRVVRHFRSARETVRS